MLAETSKNGSVVLVGSLADAHVAAVAETLRLHGHEPVVLDATRYPHELSITLGAPMESIRIDGAPLGRPAAVYLRSVYQDPVGYGVDADEAMATDWRRTMMAFRERGAVLSAVVQRWEQLGVPVYNPTISRATINKPFQLALLHEAGLPVPTTVWTNEPKSVVEFCRERDAIYKPVSGGASTRKVEARDLAPERLAALATAPVCFQDLLPGEDIRVYVIDGRVVAALRIESSAVDFRQNEIAIESIELATEVEAQCVRATEVLGLRWTGMDLKRDRHGRLVILELNPSAMFLGFDLQAGTDIRGELCRALLRHVEAGRR
jgi:glutathione synthase/RimK-type ligase-like ATP-grasp enzyme